MRFTSVARIPRILGFLLLGITAWHSALAQSAPVSDEVLPVVPSRVLIPVNELNRVTLTGNTHFLARPEFDKGLVEPQLSMERMVLVLKRSPEQEAALVQFMAEQQDPKSPNYHNWLHAERFGKLYGPSDSDIAAITNWLQNRGFQIYQVAKGRTSIEFSGTAAQVQEAFHTEIHNYLVNGKMHIANNSDPAIPEALAPVITGIASLHDFFPKHQSELGRHVVMNRKTHKIIPVGGIPTGPTSNYVFADPNVGGIPNEDIGPYDFAAMYNLTPLWNAGITGKGISVAISSQTDINVADVNTFRSFFGLSKFTGTVKQVVNGTDPGVVQGDLVENTLDTEWSGAAAPDAQIIVVASKGTATTGAGILSDEYIVDNEVAPIMSASYGECEAGLAAAGNANLNSIYQQGSAEGISMFDSAGDQGSTGCDNSDATSFPAPAQHGLQVNGFASSPYVTAVGGTDIVWQEQPYAKYWTANTANNSSAIGYIPEVPWNSTCTSSYLLTYVYTGQTSSEELCNNAYAAGLDDMIRVVGGSGGKSSCLTNTGTFASCSGAYPKPSWQTGVGVPAENVRYLPDVSLFASGGLPSGNGGSAYLICVSSNSPDSKCDFTGDNIVSQEVGGTSVSSPAMAGIMALVVQKVGSKQGLANPVFYQLAAKDNLTSCNSNTVANGNACIFYDITTGNNAMPCQSGSLNCNVSISGDTFGIVTGYTTTAGYDLATGLGSVNAYNLVNAWPTTAATLTVSLTPTALTFASTTVGATTAAQIVTIKNTGTGAVTLSSETITGTNPTSFLKSATTCGTSLAAGASCTVSVEFKPLAAGALKATLSVADNATGTPQTVTLAGTGVAASTFTVALSPTALTFASTKEGTATAAQLVTVKNTGTGSVTLSSETITGTNPTSFLKSATTCGTSLAAGASCTVSVEFKPLAAGALKATLSVADNATGTPQTVALAGTGVAASTFTVALTPTALTFASTKEGTATAAQLVTIKNTGTGAVTLSSETITGTNPTSFLKSATTCGTSLAAGASCSVSVEFKPLAAGALKATLSIADNATGTPQTVALAGTGVAASTFTVALTPTALTFASTKEGTATAAQLVTVKNTGTGAVTLSSETITGTNPTSFLKSATTCGTSLAAGASCTVSVEFKPLAAGALKATLSVADNATGTPQTVALAGTGVAASTFTVALTPTALTFASTTVGATTAAQLVTVKNTGTGAVTLSSETITGTNPTSFLKSATTCGTSLAAGASCTVSVEFKPLAAGALKATLSVADNATGTPQTVALAGTGVAASTFTVALTPTALTFASTTVGATTAAQIVTVKNTGTGAVTLSSETITGTNPTSFLKSATTCGTSLAAGASCTVSVEFKPLAAGALKATLSIADNATGTPQTVALAGTGVAATTPTVILTPTAIAFPNTALGSTSDAQPITLKNTSTVAVTISSIALGGTNATSFLELGNCGTALAAGASCSFFVAFKPASAGALIGTLSIADTAAGSPQKVTLTGTGTALPSVKLSATSIVFPTTTHGTTSAADAITLANAGTATVDLTSITLTGTNPTDFEALNTCGPSLAAGANCVIYVAFKPASAAAFKATLSIADNGSGSPQSVALSGTGK